MPNVIISTSELLAMNEFASMGEQFLQSKLDALEELVRAYTNNNFQVRAARFYGKSEGMYVYGASEYIEEGDTVQLTQSRVNDGLYTVAEVTDEYTKLDRKLFDADYNLVTKVVYPAAVKSGLIDLMKWEVTNRDRLGVQSETISRHSVTYFSMDGDSSTMGYPAYLFGFLKPYMKARF